MLDMAPEHAAAATVDARFPAPGPTSISQLRRRVTNVHLGPVTGLMGALLLLAGLAATVGLSEAGWVVGVASALITNATVAHGIGRYRATRLGLADWVTLARVTLAVGVAALVADSFHRPAPITTL